MRLVSYHLSTALGELVRLGALVENGIVDLNLAYARYLDQSGTTGSPYEVAARLMPPDMVTFFKGGELARKTARLVLDFIHEPLSQGRPVNGPRGEKIIYTVDEVKLLAPVPRPNSIRDTQSFEAHIKGVSARVGREVPEFWYQAPTYYKGNPDAVIGPDEPVLWPGYTEKLDYELEFGIYIGKQGKNISTQEAPEYIAGYTIFNDFSARDMLPQEMSSLGPAKGKDFDNSNVMGPCLVTPDELDISHLKMTARVNGEVWSEGNTADMYWSFPQIIEYISQSETLYPGDFIGSGTVGTGSGIELDRWLRPGDIVELEVAGIGTLRNPVVRE